jgi:hypothetical protein
MPPDLERALRELDPPWPPTPDIAAVVRARIAEPAPRGRLGVPRTATPGLGRRLTPPLGGRSTPPFGRRFAPPRAAWVAALLALLAAAGVLTASPSARSAVLRWLGLKGVEVRHAPPNATPPPVRRGAALQLGTPVTLGQARRKAGFPLPVPNALPPPDAVYIASGPPATRVSLVYRPQSGVPRSHATGVGLLVTAFGSGVRPFLEKTLGAGARLQRLTIAGAHALWITRSHGFAYGTAGGDIAFEPQRLADRTLLVEHGRVLLRIEGRISRARAVAIARSAL